MKKFVVSFVNFFDNDLRNKIVEAENWKEALKIVNPGQDEKETEEFYNIMPDDYEEAKYFAFNSDWLFDVIEITSPKRFSVSYINFSDSDLITKIVEADGWKDALKIAFPDIDDYSEMPDDINEAKNFAFGGEWIFEVIEI